MRLARSILLASACAATVLAAGCKSQGRIDRLFRPVTVKSTSSAEGFVAARDLMPLQAGEQRFVDWQEPARNVTIRIEPSTEFGSQWSRSESDERKEFLSVDASGNVVLHAVIEYGDKAISQFSPPLIVAFSQMPAGVEQRSESKMRVVDLNNRTKQKEIGTAVRTITYVDEQTVSIASQAEHRAKRIQVHFNARLKLANADERTTMWFVPGTGVIAEESVEEVKVLGVAGKTTHRMMTLSDLTPAQTTNTATTMPQKSRD